MSLKTRISIGQFTFVPTGEPRWIGPGTPPRGRRAGLAEVEEIGTAQSVKLIVGRNKGMQPHNKTGRCARRPRKFEASAVDQAFVELRSAQVKDRKAVGASRVTGAGWYEGKGEKNVAYEIAFIPNKKEKDFRTFKENVDLLAELLAKRFCQDSVLILRDDGKKRTVASATWKPEKDGR